MFSFKNLFLTALILIVVGSAITAVAYKIAGDKVPASVELESYYRENILDNLHIETFEIIVN